MFKQGLNSDGELIRDVFVEHVAVDLECPDDGVTRQEFRDECDINVLMASYERTGVMQHFNRMEPQYLDVSDVPDLAKALSMVASAEAAFMTLPARVRAEFDNSAVKFVEFAEKPENVSKMREWGLAAPEKVPPALKVDSEGKKPLPSDKPLGDLP